MTYLIINAITSDNPPRETVPSQQSTEQTKEGSSLATEQEFLELVRFRCYTEYDYFHIVGKVKNISDKSLESLVAIGIAYITDGEFVKSDETLIDYNPIFSGQTSPLKVLMTDNSVIKKCKVGFKKFWGRLYPNKNKVKLKDYPKNPPREGLLLYNNSTRFGRPVCINAI